MFDGYGVQTGGLLKSQVCGSQLFPQVSSGSLARYCTSVAAGLASSGMVLGIAFNT